MFSTEGKTINAYLASRLLALSLPLQQDEYTAEKRAASSLLHCLSVGQDAADFYARRCILYRRDFLLHNSFAIAFNSYQMLKVLDSLTVIGLRNLSGIQPNVGTVLVSLHYSLQSTLLTWWLIRATWRGLFNSLTVLFRAESSGQHSFAERILKVIAENEVGSHEKIKLINLADEGTSVAIRKLHKELKSGGAVFLMGDSTFLPPSEKTITVNIGQQVIGLPRGFEWLSNSSGCPIVPVFIRPHTGEGHAIVFGAPGYPALGTTPPMAQSIMQDLIDQTILTDPSPWAGWFRVDLSQCINESHQEKYKESALPSLLI